ncbi:hypothetical protein GHI93_12535 [Lactococcus hircilactis]|uniref:Core domain-containing protein n=1 Tax=Lactococcus hircilactis TaxID=1494462 RepID=A0A7X2D183_9LACT|nr:iron-sulfur cluster biosynthesis family protein [Lactococcus hircilactis]MQW40734.1 hypothetical protein [Lactococcus hircilactis]
MKLTSDQKVKEKIAGLKKENDILVLDYDDSIGDTGRPKDSCAIVSQFRLIVTAKENLTDEFDGTFESDLGKIYCKQSGKIYFDDAMNARSSSNYGFELMGAGSLLTPNLKIEKL